MELEEAIERLEDIKTLLEIDNGANLELTPRQQKLLAQNLEVVLNHLTKQEKMIEMMCYAMTHEDIPQNEYCIFRTVDREVVGGNKSCTECMRKYFEKKAEESE